MIPLQSEPSRYTRETPYEVLGVAPEASAKDIRNSYTRLERDARESGLSPAERAKRKERLESAYDQLRIAANRIRVDFFLLDRNVGVKQCRAIAESLAKPNTEIDNIIKPRRIQVTHEALFDDLEPLFREAERVSGLFIQPMDLDEAVRLPEPLAVQFDC